MQSCWLLNAIYKLIFFIAQGITIRRVFTNKATNFVFDLQPRQPSFNQIETYVKKSKDVKICNFFLNEILINSVYDYVNKSMFMFPALNKVPLPTAYSTKRSTYGWSCDC